MGLFLFIFEKQPYFTIYPDIYCTRHNPINFSKLSGTIKIVLSKNLKVKK